MVFLGLGMVACGLFFYDRARAAGNRDACIASCILAAAGLAIFFGTLLSGG